MAIYELICLVFFLFFFFSICHLSLCLSFFLPLPPGWMNRPPSQLLPLNQLYVKTYLHIPSSILYHVTHAVPTYHTHLPHPPTCTVPTVFLPSKFQEAGQSSILLSRQLQPHLCHCLHTDNICKWRHCLAVRVGPGQRTQVVCLLMTSSLEGYQPKVEVLIS